MLSLYNKEKYYQFFLKWGIFLRIPAYWYYIRHYTPDHYNIAVNLLKVLYSTYICNWSNVEGLSWQWSYMEVRFTSTYVITANHHKSLIRVRIRVMVFNAICTNISVISWWSVLLVEKTRASGENHWPVASHWQTLSHNFVSSTPCHEWDSNSQLYWW